MITTCCVCNKIHVEQGWIVPNTATLPDDAISHGYCPECFEEVMKELDAYVSSQLLMAAAAKLTVSAAR